jgi:lipopolysaccharide export system permease protein
MKILDRYIAINVLSSVFIVIFVLLAMFTFIAFFEEVDNIGRGQYDVSQAVLYVVLTVPTIVHQILPMAALLGCTIGLGILSNNSELVIIRSAGVTMRRIGWSVMKVGIVLIALGIVIGEWVAPNSERLAQTLRSVALSKQLKIGGQQGLWAKDGNDIVNARKFLPGDRLGEVFIYRMNQANQVKELITAGTAAYVDDQWILRDVTRSAFADGKVTTSVDSTVAWDTSLSPDLLNVVTVKPDTLSTIGLYHYVHYLKTNGLSADIYEQAFWSKIAAPFITALMVLLSIPFVFGSTRSVSMGQRIVVGVLMGVGFHIINQSMSYVGLVFDFNIALSAFLPILVAAVVVVWMYRRVF